MPRLCSSLLLLLIASSASAVSIDWTPIGNPGNACDPQPQGCFGAVAYSYRIGTYEVTNAQYAEFLNAKAASDPLGLYSPSMALGFGGITRSGVSGSFTYATIAGRGEMPVNDVTFYDTLRFANWMNNGQGAGSTETGAYTLLGGTASPSNGLGVTRNGGATIFLPSENEWYKAAYYSAPGTGYFDYPAGSDTQTTCAAPTATANRANCLNAVGDLTPVGSYPGSVSPYGTLDQGGNVFEWNEAIDASGSFRGFRGGGFVGGPLSLAASMRVDFGPSNQFEVVGFRLAMVPEPSTGLLVIAGLLGLGIHRRMRA
jgi:formylglycine-generating enzyme required for sulfatase activity